jgi:hypothetical protein
METLDPYELEVFFLKEAISPIDLLEKVGKASANLYPFPAFHARLIDVRSHFPHQ